MCSINILIVNNKILRIICINDKYFVFSLNLNKTLNVKRHARTRARAHVQHTRAVMVYVQVCPKFQRSQLTLSHTHTHTLA